MSYLYHLVMYAYYSIAARICGWLAHWDAHFEFEPRDCWIGVYWTPSTMSVDIPVDPAWQFDGLNVTRCERVIDCFRVYVIALPMFPLVITYVYRPELVVGGSRWPVL